MADPDGVVASYRKGNVGWYEALPPVLAVVIVGFTTSEVILRWLKPEALADKFSHRYGISVFTICLGGAIMGFLLAAALTINRVLVPGPDELLVRLPASFIPGLVGAALGQVLGLVEGLIVALPLAAILGGHKQRLTLAVQNPQHFFDTVRSLYDEVGLGGYLWRPLFALHSDPQRLSEYTFLAQIL